MMEGALDSVGNLESYINILRIWKALWGKYDWWTLKGM